MQIFDKIGSLRSYLNNQQTPDRSVGLVPTMGALHPGHLSLIEASKRENSITVCSIYVNPVQFNNPVDLEKYPRVLESDTEILKAAGCDVLFAPDNSEMYDGSTPLKFDFGSLDKILEGEFRPGHFSGVALVVAKLFNIVQPNRAYFGQKDYQQFMVISRLVKELKFDIELVKAPIVREADGLAMSSRNIRLTPDERMRSVILYQALKMTEEKLIQGEFFSTLKKDIEQLCDQNGIRLEYLAVVDSENFMLLENVTSHERGVILIAAYVGEVRLIDNLLIGDNRTL